MSCKGLIELIFLNIGLEIGIISPTVFSIFVLEAVTLTFASTPLTLLFYPPSVRGGPKEKVVRGEREGGDARWRRRFTFIITERLSNLSPIMVFSKLLARPAHALVTSEEEYRRNSTSTSSSATLDKPSSSSSEIIIDALRLVELSTRTSAVMHASEPSDQTQLSQDPINVVFETFASLNGIRVAEQKLAVVSRESFAETVVGFAGERESDFVLLPWRLSGTEVEESGASTMCTSSPLVVLRMLILHHSTDSVGKFIRPKQLHNNLLHPTTLPPLHNRRRTIHRPRPPAQSKATNQGESLSSFPRLPRRSRRSNMLGIDGAAR